MFIATHELFKIGIGPSSSHTTGPMLAAYAFRTNISTQAQQHPAGLRIRCTLYGSLAHTGKGHATDSAVLLGLHGYQPEQLIQQNITHLITELRNATHISIDHDTLTGIAFNFSTDIIFDYQTNTHEHPNALTFTLINEQGTTLSEQTYFSIGGGFICRKEQFTDHSFNTSPDENSVPHPFISTKELLTHCREKRLSIAQVKWDNECAHATQQHVTTMLDAIWSAMKQCIEHGLHTSGTLPGGLNVQRRAAELHQDLITNPNDAELNDWLCAYAMAVNEENAAGHMVVTAPTNGAAGVIPAILYYLVTHKQITTKDIHNYLLTAAAIGGIIKMRSSISGAEVGCQGEVGSAAAMAAAGLCAVRGGTPEQCENAAEIALEHHLGMTCDPVKGLVQIPCIERNGIAAVKAYTAATLALRGTGEHLMPLDNCIAAMKETGREMSHKYRETSLGGLAVNYPAC